LDNFGVIWAQFGVVSDKVGNIKTTGNRVFDIKNAENTEFPHLIPSKTPAS